MGQDMNLAQKIAVLNVGCVFACFCGGHKNNFPIKFSSSIKLKKNVKKQLHQCGL